MPDEQYNNSVTGEAIPDFPILTKGSGKTSNIILALSGLPPFDGSTFQQMPVNGPPSTRSPPGSTPARNNSGRQRLLAQSGLTRRAVMRAAADLSPGTTA
jgi:hypothetical protein